MSPAPASFGQPVTISVTVAPPVGSALIPTGSVQLQVNGTSYGAAIPLVSGAATIHIPDPANKIPDPSLILPVTLLDSSGNLVGVQYSGEVEVYSAATQTVGLTVLPTIVVSSNPAVYGQPITFSSTVYNPAASSLAAPSITAVVFGWDDSPTSPSVPVNSSTGQAQFTPQAPQFPLAVGNHFVQATAYESELLFQFSNTLNFTINQAGTATALSLLQSGSNATLTATVAVVAPGAGKPTGTVSFTSGSNVLGTAPLTNAMAVLSLTSFSGTVSATYSGDTNFGGSTSSLVTVSPPPPPPVAYLSLSSSLNPSQFGQAVTFTASLTVTSGTGTPSGTVQFLDGTNSIGSAALSGGSASVTTSSLAVGSHAIIAQYSGDKVFAAVSASLGQVVNRLASTLTLTASPAQVNAGQSVALKALIGPAPPSGSSLSAPTGQVTFSAGGNSLGSAAISGGSAGITATNLPAGTVQVTALYSGDSNYAASSAIATVTVISSPSLVTVSATLPDGKQGANYSGTVSVSGGAPPYNLVITGLPPGVTATVSASGASATIAGQPTTSGSFTVTVQATDSKGISASKAFPVNIASTAPSITPVTPGTGTAGQPYSQCITVSGGTPPYLFSATLPTGLSIDPATGCISGTPSVGGPVMITVTVTDSSGAQTTVTFTVNFALPALSLVNFTGLGNAADPRTQPGFGVAITGPYPVDIQGTLTLRFQPATGADTGEATFATGSRTLTFTIPASSTNAVFTIPTAALQTGTVAGSITITASFKAGATDITPSPAPSKQIQVNAGTPVIVSATAARNSNGFTVSITGYTSTREISEAMFVFNPATGANLQTASLTLQVGSIFASWLEGSQVIGSQFLFTQPFTVTGNLQAVASITVTLVNGQGSSQVVTAPLQ